MNNAEVMQHHAQIAGVRRYDGVSMALHWFTLSLLIVLYGSIWAREQASDGDAAALLLTLHRSAGALIWVATLARLAWKVTSGRAPALPPTMPQVQRWAEVAAIVYKRRMHTINVFVQPAGRLSLPVGIAAKHDGYSLVRWTNAGLEFWAVSDIDLSDLELFHHTFANQPSL